MGRPSSVNPLTARTQADRDLVALVYRGLVRLGPDGAIVPDLAERVEVNSAGTSYTFVLRDDALWQDGVAVTADDVAFTVGVLQDPAYSGPRAASWAGVELEVIDSRTVRFDLVAPLGGFLQAATQPLVPAHLLRGVPVDRLSDDPFNEHPVGNGPFRLVSWSNDEATLEAVDPSGILPGDPVGPPAPPDPPSRAVPYLQRIQLRFYPDGAALAAAFAAGDVDAASGLDPDQGTALAATTGARLLEYPSVTFTTVILNLRQTHPELRSPDVRRALLLAIDRDRLIRTIVADHATRADSPIPPSSWAFDAGSSPRVPYQRTEAARLLRHAGWRKASSGWKAPRSSKPYVLELLTLPATVNPVLAATAEQIAADWRSFGLTVKVVHLSPAKLADEHLSRGAFDAVVVNVNIGLDPDLYPLLASTQVVAPGANVSGIQDPTLDRRLLAARAPGSSADRRAAYGALQAWLATSQPMLPIFFRDHIFVVSRELQGPTPRELGDLSDRYWDVLTWRFASGP